MTGEMYGMVLSTLAVFACTVFIVRFGWPHVVVALHNQEQRYDRVLNHQLLMNTSARQAMLLTGLFVVGCGTIAGMLGESVIWFILGAAGAMFMPNVLLVHMETKRRMKLESQLVDGITSLSSGVRAGLTLVQSMQLLVNNAVGPIKQEFQQMLHEYELGIDLNQAMLNASDRIGSSHYRLLFAAIQAHRDRGGDVAQSLDRITDAIREIQRLEGKLQALTAQGRNQATMMAAMAVVVMIIGYLIAPEEMENLFQAPQGRLILLIAVGLIAVGFAWIRRIMAVEI